MSFNVKKLNPQEEHKPWIILINGLFASLESWNQSLECLSSHFRVLRYDGRGQGKGPRPTSGYDLKDLTADLKTILDEEKIKRAYLLGLSNGGRVALNFAALYPERVIAISASDTYAVVTPLLKLKLSSWLEANRLGGPSLRFKVAAPWIWGETITNKKPELIEQYRKLASLEKIHVTEGLIRGAMSDHAIDLQAIACPVLLTVGEEDLLTPSFTHTQMRDSIIHCELKVIKGGHASLLENAESIEEEILPWLLLQREGHAELEELNAREGFHNGMD